ncbi:unnamed protein product [Lampetra fluviatilis]
MAASAGGGGGGGGGGRRNKTTSRKKHFVSQKMKLFRASDPLFSVLMWGVNHSINELAHVPARVMLLPDDFKAHTKTKVDNHLFNKENMPSRFKFKEYCPVVFRNLRERFGVSEQEYLVSLTSRAPVNSDARGRSGARVFTTYDRRFVVKTIVGEDVADMHTILMKYHQYVVECHGNTLLPQFLGMYRLGVDGADTYLVVTRNVFSPHLSVHCKYDLKGCTLSREASEKEKAKDLPTFKDNDFINEKKKIVIGEEDKKAFLEKLRRDVEFLVQLKMMGYSLLVGIYDVEAGDQDEVDDEADEDYEDDDEEEETKEAEAEQEEEERRRRGWRKGSRVGRGSVDAANGTAARGGAGGAASPEAATAGGGGAVAGSSGATAAGAAPSGTGSIYAIVAHESAGRKEVYYMGIIDILTHYDAKRKAAHAAKTVKSRAGAVSTVNPEQYSKRFLDFMASILE